jgi:flagellar assembly protein FliH
VRKFLFNNVIKSVSGKNAAVKSYAMRDMGRDPGARKERARSLAASSGGPASTNKTEVEQLLEEIEEREKYIKQMTDKTHSLEKEAYEKGFRQGEQAGRELGAQRFDSVIKSFTEALEDLRQLQEEWYQHSEPQLVELVLAISRAIIQKELDTDKSIVLNVIQSALLAVADQERITMKVHPSDLEFARQHKKEMTEGIEGVGKLIFEGDEGVSRGGAVIESSQGIVDCGIEKHLNEVEKALREKAREGAHFESEQEEDGTGSKA